MSRNRLFLCLSALACMASCADPAPPPSTAAAAKPVETPAPTPPPAPPRGKPKLGTFGIDMAGADTTVKPGKDFYAFAGGRWQKDTQIPADRSRWGVFDQLREESDANVRKILDEQVQSKSTKGDNAQKVADFYAAYLDTAAIDQKGFAPAKADLEAIAKAKTLVDIVKLMGRPDLPVKTPIDMEVILDDKNPDRYVVGVSQGGLGLPDREFYLKKEKQFEEIRTKYLAHVTKVLAMVGDKQAAANAKAILALETQIAERHWPIAERREREKTYNPRTIAELQKEAPQFPWKVYLDAQGYGSEPSVIVAENTAVVKLAQLFPTTPIPTWKSYLTYHFLRSSADVLPTQLDDEVFDFTGRTLNGQPQQRERWKRGVGAVNGALGDAVGELYVARFFQPKAKAEMDRLVENLRKGYAARIQSVDWMTAETKKVALEKLATFRPKIGYPVKWKNYASLQVAVGDAFGNKRRSQVWHHEYERAKLGKPSDRDEWFMTPQTVNAYYNPTFNEIVFPAAILQPPFFDPEADPAVNYGGIGGVIGHEMGHGFDDQGAKSDAKGVLRTWWGPADIEAFKKRTDALAEQYSMFEPLPGIKVNGRLTLGENIGDVGGLTVAYQAYQLSLEGKPAPTLDGYTGDQRFFLGWAQVWRALYRDQALRNQVLTDPHSPALYRVNGVVRNLDAWYKAFDVKADDPLYLAPDKRVKIW
ncbi:M13 family metallopeptidase [Pendulispora brunnea]|uniref:M13 family metallopeptidase n=1 Tax=Pendulispora brunnea TaxID=2905690 RepID=A0ABZ2KA67_9BACT